jgi:membrane protein DedA with SNARE-associated domain
VSLLLQDSFLQSLFTEHIYLAPFMVLLLCGLGLPLPEEVTLIGSGLLVYQGRADFLTISVVCSVAILLGDSAPYFLGRRYGSNALKIGWVRRILHPERFALLEKRFAEHGNWAIFTCRFLPGIRIPGYFTAGTLRMGYGRFIVLDTLGVLISVPLSIYLGKLFGDSIERLEKSMENFHLILGFAIVSLVLIMYVRGRGRHREREVQAVEEADAKANTSRDNPPPEVP